MSLRSSARRPPRRRVRRRMRSLRGSGRRPGAATWCRCSPLTDTDAWGAAGPRSEPAQQHEAPAAAPDLSEDAEFARFLEAAGRGNMVPLDARLFSDQLTPVTAYRTLVAADDREAPSFLFESVVNGTQTVCSAFLQGPWLACRHFFYLK